jgi:hypothetical protein
VRISRDHNVQTGSEARPASYPMVTWDNFPSNKAGKVAKLTTQLQLLPRSKIVELFLYSLLCFHGIVIN